MDRLTQFMGSASSATSGALKSGTQAATENGVGGMMQAGGGILAALQSFGIARQRARQLRQDSKVEEAAARAEIGTFDQAAKQATDRYLDAVSANRAAAAASGVDVASGSVAAVNDRSRNELTSWLAIARENAVAGAVARRARAQQLIGEAQAQNRAAWIGLIGDIGQTAVGLGKLGKVPGPKAGGG